MRGVVETRDAVRGRKLKAVESIRDAMVKVPSKLPVNAAVPPHSSPI